MTKIKVVGGGVGPADRAGAPTVADTLQGEIA